MDIGKSATLKSWGEVPQMTHGGAGIAREHKKKEGDVAQIKKGQRQSGNNVINRKVVATKLGGRRTRTTTGGKKGARGRATELEGDRTATMAPGD